MKQLFEDWKVNSGEWIEEDEENLSTAKLAMSL